MKKHLLPLCFLAFASAGFASAAADTLQPQRHFERITSTPETRNHRNLGALNQVADYTHAALVALKGQVTEQVHQAVLAFAN